MVRGKAVVVHLGKDGKYYYVKAGKRVYTKAKILDGVKPKSRVSKARKNMVKSKSAKRKRSLKKRSKSAKKSPKKSAKRKRSTRKRIRKTKKSPRKRKVGRPRKSRSVGRPRKSRSVGRPRKRKSVGRPRKRSSKKSAKRKSTRKRSLKKRSKSRSKSPRKRVRKTKSRSRKSRSLSIPSEKAGSNRLEGKKVVFSGFRDQDLVDRIEQLGGRVMANVSGKTDMVVVEDLFTVTDKTSKALSLGIPIKEKSLFVESYLM
jgi:NAD-dependent DNA ligase